jgi:hypothetical protein
VRSTCKEDVPSLAGGAVGQPRGNQGLKPDYPCAITFKTFSRNAISRRTAAGFKTPPRIRLA